MKGLLLLVALGGGAALAEPNLELETASPRGWRSITGLGLAGAGTVALSLAAYQAGQAESAGRTIAAYYAHGAAPTQAEAPRLRWLAERWRSSSTQAVALLISGGAAVALGVGLVLLDGRAARASITVAIQPSGASVLITGGF